MYPLELIRTHLQESSHMIAPPPDSWTQDSTGLPIIPFYDVKRLLDPPDPPEQWCELTSLVIPGASKQVGSQELITIPCQLNDDRQLAIGEPLFQEVLHENENTSDMLLVTPLGQNAILIAFHQSDRSEGKVNLEGMMCTNGSFINRGIILDLWSTDPSPLFWDSSQITGCHAAAHTVNQPLDITFLNKDGSETTIQTIQNNNPNVMIFRAGQTDSGYITIVTDSTSASLDVPAHLVIPHITDILNEKFGTSLSIAYATGVDVDISRLEPLPLPVPRPITIEPSSSTTNATENVYSEPNTTSNDSQLQTESTTETELQIFPAQEPLRAIENGKIVYNVEFGVGTNIDVYLVDPTEDTSVAKRLFGNLTQLSTSESIQIDTETLIKHSTTFEKIKTKWKNALATLRKEKEKIILQEKVVKMRNLDGFSMSGLTLLHMEHEQIGSGSLTIYATNENGEFFIFKSPLKTWLANTTLQVTDQDGTIDPIRTTFISQMMQDLTPPHPDPATTSDKEDIFFLPYDMPPTYTYSIMHHYANTTIQNTPFKSGFILDNKGNLISSNIIPANFHGQFTGDIRIIGDRLYVGTTIDKIEFPDLTGVKNIFIEIGVIGKPLE